MSVFGYLRVSTADQETENQRYEILKFADERKVRVDEWCAETVSGTRSYTDRLLGQFMAKMHAGDTLIVTEISRLGRSLMEVMEILNHLLQQDVRVLTCKERFELGDNINSKVMAFAFSLGAEIERQMISQRTREALARKKAEGKQLGRPKGTLGHSKLDDRAELIKDLLGKGVAKASLCRILDCAGGTLDDFLRTRKIIVRPPN